MPPKTHPTYKPHNRKLSVYDQAKVRLRQQQIAGLIQHLKGSIQPKGGKSHTKQHGRGLGITSHHLSFPELLIIAH